MKYLPIVSRLVLAAALIGTAIFLRELTFDMKLYSVADKLQHALVYGCIAWALLFFMQPVTFRRLFWMLGVIMAIGVIDEVRQIASDRHADLLDWLANLAGASIAGAAWKLSHRLPPSAATTTK
jgi:VanZ family protein